MASKCDNNFRKASFRVRLFAIDLIAATLIFLCVSSPRCCGSVGGGLTSEPKIPASKFLARYVTCMPTQVA
jgi:hypothetical protein